jgi:hypothetical protein
VNIAEFQYAGNAEGWSMKIISANIVQVYLKVKEITVSVPGEKRRK